MQALCSHPVIHRARRLLSPAPRLLSAAGAARALHRFGLPSYDWARAWLQDYALRVRGAALWEAVFGGIPAELADGLHGAWDLDVAFVERVNDELFPLDEDFDDMTYNSGDNPLDVGILPQGRGVPWEMVDLDEIGEVETLVLATVYQSGAIDPPEADYWREADALIDDEILSWCRDRDVKLPAWRLPHTWDGIAAFRQALRFQPEPLDALADVLNTLLKTSGNPFLDSVGAFWQAEYDGAYSSYCWCADCVKELAAQYQAARPAIARLDNLKQWYDLDLPASRAVVLDALARAADGGPEYRSGRRHPRARTLIELFEEVA